MLCKLKLFLVLTFLSLNVYAKEISVIIPFSPGGPTDTLWRYIEPQLNLLLDKHSIRLISENVPGAAGTIAANKISNTKDKIVLGFFSPALVIAPTINPNIVAYQKNTFKLIGYAGSTEMYAVSKLTYEELIEKCKTGRLLYGTSNIGSTGHLMGYLVSKKLRCNNAVAIPYKGISNMYPDLVEKRIDYFVDFAITADGFIRSGTVNKLIDIDKELSTELENWHVLVSNNIESEDINIIIKEFRNLKSDPKFVLEIERNKKVKNFRDVKDQNWFETEFDVYNRFIKSTM